MPIWVWTFDPWELVPIACAAGLYALRARRLAGGGRPVPPWRLLAFAAGLACALVAVVSPVDFIGEQYLFSVHMIQHLLLGDLAPLLIVLGLSRPLLRPVLALPLLGRLRILCHPLVALPVWAVDLYLWHLPFLYDAALRHDGVHALEHTLFFVCGSFMWAALLDLMPGPVWFGTGAKLLYVIAVRFAEGVLANFFIWSGTSLYPPYLHAVRIWGLSAASDQRLGGVAMLAEGSLVTLAAFAWLFLRWADESELRQRLLERGLRPEAVERAVRYGRARSLDGEREAQAAV